MKASFPSVILIVLTGIKPDCSQGKCKQCISASDGVYQHILEEAQDEDA
jgi:hypothetical protein